MRVLAELARLELPDVPQRLKPRAGAVFIGMAEAMPYRLCRVGGKRIPPLRCGMESKKSKSKSNSNSNNEFGGPSLRSG
jgi:hypothetical protein